MILLHKVAYDYVTLFDVYECAISPVVLERKLKEAERRLGESDSVLVSEDNYLKHPRDLEPFQFRLNTDLGLLVELNFGQASAPAHCSHRCLQRAFVERRMARPASY